jgi:hypothetical protein
VTVLRQILLLVAFVLGCCSVVGGVAMMSVPWALIVAGPLIAVVAVVSLAELK